MKLEFSTNLSELKNDILTITKYAKELRDELGDDDKYSQLANFEGIVHAAISQLRYFKDAKTILESSKEELDRKLIDLSNENLELRRTVAVNRISIARINELSKQFNTNDLDEFVSKVLREHNELAALKEVIHKSNDNTLKLSEEIVKLRDENKDLNNTINELQTVIEKNKDKSTVQMVGSAAAGFMASVFVLAQSKNK